MELEAEDEEEHLHEAGVIRWLRNGKETDLSKKWKGTKESDETQSFNDFSLL